MADPRGEVSRYFGRPWVRPPTIRLNLEVSTDNGVTWTTVSVVNASSGQFTWDSTVFGAAPLVRWRLTSNDEPSITDSSGTFSLRNGSLQFYVNDADPLDDEYTTDIGKISHDGASPETPKLTVQAILDAYDLEPGDAILV